MALANIIKEVDPPVELTQAEYDALSTAQKNDGTVYFITDGNGAFQTAATTPAEDTSSGTSNVQDELQKKVEKADIVNNFTTTQKGYVADARALKTIADNYSLKTDLPKTILDHWKGAATTVSNDTVTELYNFELTEPGCYLIVMYVNFPVVANQTGVRGCICAEDISKPSLLVTANDFIKIPASSTTNTVINAVRIWNAESPTTMHFMAWQNSSASIANVRYMLNLVKIV